MRTFERRGHARVCEPPLREASRLDQELHVRGVGRAPGTTPSPEAGVKGHDGRRPGDHARRWAGPEPNPPARALLLPQELSYAV